MAGLANEGKLMVIAGPTGEISGACMVTAGAEISGVLEALPGQRLHVVEPPDPLKKLGKPEFLSAVLAGACVTEAGELVLRKLEIRD